MLHTARARIFTSRNMNLLPLVWPMCVCGGQFVEPLINSSMSTLLNVHATHVWHGHGWWRQNTGDRTLLHAVLCDRQWPTLPWMCNKQTTGFSLFIK